MHTRAQGFHSALFKPVSSPKQISRHPPFSIAHVNRTRTRTKRKFIRIDLRGNINIFRFRCHVVT